MKEIFVFNWVYFATGILFVLVGIYIKRRKAYSLIAGYNTMSAEKKKKINIGMVAIAVRNAFILLGILLIIIPILTEQLGINQLRATIIIASHSVVLISLVIIIKTRSKYKISE